MRSTWTNCGPEHGLWCRVVSDKGHCIHVALTADAEELALILNQLEEAAAFGWQCLQDQFEGAFVEQSVHKRAIESAKVCSDESSI